MIIFRKAQDIRRYLDEQKQAVGFIPTMGALHKGHISLIAQARADGCLSVCSIFVNPTQFNDREDFRHYPISIEADIELLLTCGCDVLFLPSEDEVYPQGTVMAPAYHFGELEQLYEGAHRPGHFRGVGQVVARLLDIIQPRYLYMGRKDYQQCLVVGKLIAAMGREAATTLITGDTVREPDGLAMSSRNRRLTEPQRNVAATIYQCLVSIQAKAGSSRWRIMQKECTELLAGRGFQPEYISLADAETLEELRDFDASRKLVALIAASLGKVRLIDNMVIG